MSKARSAARSAAPWSKSPRRATTRAALRRARAAADQDRRGQPQRRGDRGQRFPLERPRAQDASREGAAVGRRAAQARPDSGPGARRRALLGARRRQPASSKPAARLSSHINRFNLAGDLRYRRQWGPGGGPDPPPELEGSLIASGRIGDVRVRGSAAWQISPDSRVQDAPNCRPIGRRREKADFEGALAYDAQARLARARLTHIRRFDTMAVALTGEAASDGSVAVGFNLNFSLDSSRRGFALSRQQLATAGAVRATRVPRPQRQWPPRPRRTR